MTDWAAAAATHIGSVHRRRGIVNQDAHLIHDDGGRCIAVVADGHGHPRYFRSEIGARLACEVAVSALLLASPPPDADAPAPDVDASALARALVEGWRERVLDHLEQHPLSTDEAAGLNLATWSPYEPYGSTLLALAGDASRLVAVQLGDGDLVLVGPDGTARRPFPEDPDHDGVHTHSLAEPDPVPEVQVAVIDLEHEPVALAFACTDGFGKPQVDADWAAQTGVQLLDRVRADGLDQVSTKLAAWLAEPAELGGDDTTLALLTR